MGKINFLCYTYRVKNFSYNNRGYTLVEVLVAFTLLTTVVFIAIGLLPSGALSLSSAQNLDIATALAKQALTENIPTPERTFTKEYQVELNRSLFDIHVYSSNNTTRSYELTAQVSCHNLRKPVTLTVKKLH